MYKLPLAQKQKQRIFFYYLLTLWFSLTVISCSSTDLTTLGEISPSEFHGKINFSTAKSVILVPAEFEGEMRNYLFDTGATVTSIQRDSTFGDPVTVRGASGRTKQNGSEILPSFVIGGINFRGTFATNEDMVGLKEQIPNFGGVLGRTIINKANWLINYPSKIIEFSNKDLSDDSFMDIELIEENNAPHTLVEINGKFYDAIIDLGSVSTFNVPVGTELAGDLLNTYDFKEFSRERYTVGGSEIISEQLGTIPLVRLGSLEFNDVTVNINQSSQIRLGMGFFSKSILYIDNSNQRYRLKKNSNH